jgi:tRNA-dihydrouridine synthase
MEDVTDFPFRQVLLKIGRPEVFFTEFVNVDGLTSQGQKHVIHRLEKNDEERPIILQLWGNNPEKFAKAVEFVKDLDFQGININLGCPVKKVMKTGCGSALIGQYGVVKEIVEAVKGIKTKMSVSVKTRVGIEKFDEEWIIFLLKLKLETIFLHARTANQVFTGNADWNLIKEVINIKKVISPETKIVGNGDVKSLKQGKDFMKENGVDGVMIGREVMKNPWVFSEKIPKKEERLQTLLFHLEEMEKFTKKFPKKGWSSIKKFYHGYLREDEELVSLRNELFQIDNLEKSKKIVEKFL